MYGVSSGVSFVDMLIIYIKKIIMKKQLMSKELCKNDKNIDPRLAAELAAAGITYEEYLRIKNQ